jgi:hypothetical protein
MALAVRQAVRDNACTRRARGIGWWKSMSATLLACALVVRERAARSLAVLFWVISGASLCSLLVVQGCTAPAAYARSGRVLDARRFRLSVSTTTGVTRAQVRVTTAPTAKSTREITTYSDYLTTKWRVGSYGILEYALEPFMSPEVQASYSPWGRCEIGALMSLTRIGAELRCGALSGELGPLQMALSAGVARLILLGPIGQEFRAGVDLSLAGSEVSPLIDIYIARMPWRRGGEEEIPGPRLGDRTHVNRDRTEWRLSMPVGIDVHGASMRSNHIVLALIPEITLASQDWPNADPQREVDIRQVWALFLAIRYEAEP